jgi:hypothetical protein
VAAFRAYRAARGALALNLDGTHRHPERFSRRFAAQVARARKALGDEQLAVIRLYHLRDTHATLLLGDGVPVKVVSVRFGARERHHHAHRYQHAHPAWVARRRTASRSFQRADPRPQVSSRYHQGLGRRT